MATIPSYVWDQWTGTTSNTSAINYLYNQAVWDSWTTTSYTTTSYSSTTAGDEIWYSWNDAARNYYKQPIGAQQYYQQQIWGDWNQNFEYISQQQPVKLTAEMVARQQEEATAQMQAERRRAEVQENKWRKQQEERKKAEATAKAMLLDIIGEKERSIYEETGQVYVQGRRHGYIIRNWGHVKRIEGNGQIREFCVHLAENFKYPDTDNVIALLMAIKYDENRLLRTANRKYAKPICDYDEKELRAACMPKDALKTKLELPVAAPTLGQGIAA